MTGPARRAYTDLTYLMLTYGLIIVVVLIGVLVQDLPRFGQATATIRHR
jgi:hypothetical protein